MNLLLCRELGSVKIADFGLALDENATRLTTAGNRVIRPIGIKYVLTGQVLPARVDGQDGQCAVVKAVRMRTPQAMVAATNPSSRRLTFTVRLAADTAGKARCYAVDSTMSSVEVRSRDGEVILPFDLPPGGSTQYVLELTPPAPRAQPGWNAANPGAHPR